MRLIFEFKDKKGIGQLGASTSRMCTGHSYASLQHCKTVQSSGYLCKCS